MGEFPEHTNQKNTQTRKLKDFQNPELTARHLQSETSVPDYAKAMPGKPETTDSFANLNYLNGAVLIFDKPYQWTSFDLVRKVHNTLLKTLGVKKIKVGHAGTLDPLATGLMIVCTGKMTKKIDELQNTSKEYIATLELGKTTPSFDLEKPIDQEFPTAHITPGLVREKIPLFLGEIDQVPPLFSAKSVDGKRAYELARKGSDVELKSNRVTIHEIEVLDFALPVLKIRVVCSKGTYIRSLARDIGRSLDSGAHLTALQRTRSGDYDIKNAISIDFWYQYMLSLQAEKRKVDS